MHVAPRPSTKHRPSEQSDLGWSPESVFLQPERPGKEYAMLGARGSEFPVPGGTLYLPHFRNRNVAWEVEMTEVARDPT